MSINHGLCPQNYLLKLNYLNRERGDLVAGKLNRFHIVRVAEEKSFSLVATLTVQTATGIF